MPSCTPHQKWDFGLGAGGGLVCRRWLNLRFLGKSWWAFCAEFFGILQIMDRVAGGLPYIVRFALGFDVRFVVVNRPHHHRSQSRMLT